MRKASLLMLTSLILIAAGMLAPTPVETQYTPGETAVFKVRFSDGTTFKNHTAPTPYDVGSKFNITLEIHNVTLMTGFTVSMGWNSVYVIWTGGLWMSSVMKAKMDAGQWSSALKTVKNDWEIPQFPHLGGVDGYAQAALGAEYHMNGTFELFTMEFQIVSYGPSWFYIYKTWDPAYPGNTKEQLMHLWVPWSPTGWGTPTTPMGETEPYDCVWATPDYLGISNCLLIVMPPPPYPPEAIKTVDPEEPIVNENATVTVTQTKPGFNGTALCPITNVTIDWGDTSPTESMAPVAGVATFTHNYTDVGDYDIEVYCYAEGMPPDLAWYNITNPITVVPEFPAYLLMPLFLTATIIAVVVAKTVWSKRPRGRVDVK